MLAESPALMLFLYILSILISPSILLMLLSKSSIFESSVQGKLILKTYLKYFVGLKLNATFQVDLFYGNDHLLQKLLNFRVILRLKLAAHFVIWKGIRWRS